jgi:hypothetical protein
MLVFAAGAQQPAASPTDEKPSSIQGVVVNALTGEPVLRAHVMCDGSVAGKQQQFGAMTNAEGKYSITGLPAGSYWVTVEKTAFVAPIENGRRGTQLTLKPGDTRSDIQLKLTPTGAILGRVTDTDGNPVETAGVYADLGGMNGRRGGAVTDEKGNFRIGGLEPGRYRIRASPSNLPFPPEIRTDGSVEPHFVPTYHPDSLDSKGATRVIVKSGADITGVDVKLRRTPFVRISGLITGIPEGTQSSSLRLELRDESGSTRSMNVVGADGKFEYWNLDPGKWVVSGVIGNRDQMVRSAPLEVEIGQQNVDNLELRMVAPFEVTGQIGFTDESAKPKLPPSGGQPPRFSLQDAARVGRVSGTMPVPLTADGTFKFSNVSPGKYRFNFGWRASIKSIRLGTVEMEDGIIDLRLGTSGAPLTVVMAPAVAEISGLVRDEKGPAAGVTVVLRNIAIGPGSTNSYFQAASGADGSYRLANVPIGKYVLTAVDEGGNSLMNDNFEDYEDVLENVEIRGDEKIVKDLKRHPRR